MRKILFAVVLLLIPPAARSACVTQSSGLGLGIPALSDNGSVWAPCYNNDMTALNALQYASSATVTSTSAYGGVWFSTSSYALFQDSTNFNFSDVSHSLYLGGGVTASSGTFTATGASQYSLTTSSGIKISAGSISATASTMTISQVNGTNSISDSGLVSCVNGVTTDASGKLTCSSSGVPLTTASSPTLTGQWTFNANTTFNGNATFVVPGNISAIFVSSGVVSGVATIVFNNLISSQTYHFTFAGTQNYGIANVGVVINSQGGSPDYQYQGYALCQGGTGATIYGNSSGNSAYAVCMDDDSGVGTASGKPMLFSLIVNSAYSSSGTSFLFQSEYFNGNSIAANCTTTGSGFADSRITSLTFFIASTACTSSTNSVPNFTGTYYLWREPIL